MEQSYTQVTHVEHSYYLLVVYTPTVFSALRAILQTKKKKA